MTTIHADKIVAIKARDQQALVDYWTGRATAGVKGLPAVESGITMPCGEVVSYTAKEDIPARSVPCPCGNETHWLVLYDVEPEPEPDLGPEDPAAIYCKLHQGSHPSMWDGERYVADCPGEKVLTPAEKGAATRARNKAAQANTP